MAKLIKCPACGKNRPIICWCQQDAPPVGLFGRLTLAHFPGRYPDMVKAQTGIDIEQLQAELEKK